MSDPYGTAYQRALDQIDQANLSTAHYRTARRLLDLAVARNGYIELHHDDTKAVVGSEAWGTVRSHLIALEKAGLIVKWLNHSTRIWFLDYPQPAWMTDDYAKELWLERANSRVLTTPDIETESQKDCEESHDRAPDARTRAPDARTRAPDARTRAPDDHLLTHAGAQFPLVVCLDDPISPLSVEDQNQTTKQPNTEGGVGEGEQALSHTLLTHIGIAPRKARRLAAEISFDLVRRAVGRWWMGRGNRFGEEPGIVVTWLENLDAFGFPPWPVEFMRTDLYLDYCRTPAERQADAAAEAEAERQLAEWEAQDRASPPALAPPVVAEPAPPTLDELRLTIDTSEFDPHAVWQMLLRELAMQLPSATYDAWVRDTWVIGYADGEFTIGLPDKHARDWVENRLSFKVKRALDSLLQRKTSVCFAVAPSGQEVDP